MRRMTGSISGDGAAPPVAVNLRRRSGVERSMFAPRPSALRPLAYAVLAMLMTAPLPWQLASRVPGDGGDALFLVWTMRWVNHAAPHGWSALWDANIFA